MYEYGNITASADAISESEAAGILGFIAVYAGVVALISIIFAIISIVSWWKIYTKADKPGWASLIPIYNIIVLLEIIEKPVWWLLLMFVPIVNIVIGFMLAIELAKAFDKGTGFALLLIFFPIIGYPILAFGDSEYVLKGENLVAPTSPINTATLESNSQPIAQANPAPVMSNNVVSPNTENGPTTPQAATPKPAPATASVAPKQTPAATPVASKPAQPTTGPVKTPTVNPVNKPKDL